MSRVRVESERVIAARPDTVYQVLSDYKDKRQQILTPNFLNYTVEKGGQGSGTVVSYRLHAARRERPYRLAVDEPQKGRIIRESDTGSSLVTLWTLAPVNEGEQTRVRVITEWEGGKGVSGFFERTFAPLGLRSIYRRMLLALTGQVQPSGTALPVNEQNVPLNILLVTSAVGLVIAVGIGIGIRLLRSQDR